MAKLSPDGEHIKRLGHRIHNQRVQIRYLEDLCWQRSTEGRWRVWFELAKKYHRELIWWKRAFDHG